MDETSLHNFFATVEDRFTRFEEILNAQAAQINNLNSQLSNRQKQDSPDKADIIKNEFELRFNQINDRFNVIERNSSQHNDIYDKLSAEIENIRSFTINSIEDLRKDILSQVNTIIQNNEIKNKANIESALDQLKEKIKAMIPKDNSQDIERLNHDINELKSNQNIYETDSQSTKDFIKTIANSYAMISKQTVGSLNQSLSEILNSTTSKLIEELSTIPKLASEIEECKQIANKPIPIRPPSPDISKLELREQCPLDFMRPPVFPTLKKFSKIENAVDFIYELVPVVQSYVLTNRQQIIDNIDDMDRQNEQLECLRNDLSEMRQIILRLPTREDFSLAMKTSRKTIEPDSCRGIGFAKCIACGREVQTAVSSERSLLPTSARRITPTIVTDQNFSSRPSYHNVYVRRKPQTPR